MRYQFVIGFMQKQRVGIGLTLGLFVLLATPAHAEEVSIYSHPSDGSVQTTPYPGVWSSQHATTDGKSSEIQDTRSAAYSDIFNSTDGVLGIHRSFLAFDTSVIPDNAVITSATLYVHPDFVFNAFDDQYSYMNVLQSFQASPTNVSFDDIEMCGDMLVHPVKGANDIDLSGITVDSYVPFLFNATGRGWVSVAGYTTLCLREGHDIENVEPLNDGNFWKGTGITYYTSEAPGTSTDPYLVVTYTVDEDEDPTLAELIQAFRDTVVSYDLPRKVERSYLAQILLLERSVERERYNAAYAQVLVLKLSLVHDKKHKNLSGAEYNELVSQLETIKDLIATYR